MTLDVQLARNGRARPKHDERFVRDPSELSRMSQTIALDIAGDLPSPAPLEEEDEDEDDDDDDDDDDEDDEDDEDDDDEDEEVPVPG